MNYMTNHLLKFGFLLGESIDSESVKTHLDRLGYTYRIVERNGAPMVVTADFRPDRLDLAIRNNKIIGF